MPTIYDYSLSVQRLLPGQMLLDVAYVGNLQRHQPIQFNLNAVPLGYAYLPQFIDPSNPGSNFAGTVNRPAIPAPCRAATPPIPRSCARIPATTP